MDKEIIIALFPAVAMVVVQLIVSNKQQKIADIKQQYTIDAMNEHIERVEGQIARLEAKQDRHNNLIERVAIIERDVKTAFNRLDEIREDIRTTK